MYQLVSHVPEGLGKLKSLLEKHICTQGLTAIEKCSESALNVSVLKSLYNSSTFKVYSSVLLCICAFLPSVSVCQLSCSSAFDLTIKLAL